MPRAFCHAAATYTVLLCSASENPRAWGVRLAIAWRVSRRPWAARPARPNGRGGRHRRRRHHGEAARTGAGLGRSAFEERLLPRAAGCRWIDLHRADWHERERRFDRFVQVGPPELHPPSTTLAAFRHAPFPPPPPQAARSRKKVARLSPNNHARKPAAMRRRAGDFTIRA